MLYIPPCQNITTAASFFYRPPQQDFTFPRLGCTFALSYSLAFPSIIATNAVHCCSQQEFPVNIEEAIIPPYFCMYIPVTSFSFLQGSDRGAAGLWSTAGGHATKAMSESFNKISTQRRKEASKCKNYREIPVPGKTFTRMLLRTTKKYKRAEFCRWTGWI